MDENIDFKVTKIPEVPFEELGKDTISKGDLGEKFVEMCLKVLYLIEGKDFGVFARRESFKKEPVPDFTDRFKKGIQTTFEIEVKNLGLNSDVSKGWLEQNLPPYWFKICNFEKVLIIFGGRINPEVPAFLKKEDIHYIHYENPIDAKDYHDLIWWLKDELLGVSSIRKKIIAAINRDYRNSPLASLLPFYPMFQDRLFLTLKYDNSKSCYILRSFPKREWESEEEIYKSAISGENSSHEWEVKLEELNKSA
jgi:hypothetical protein